MKMEINKTIDVPREFVFEKKLLIQDFTTLNVRQANDQK